MVDDSMVFYVSFPVAGQDWQVQCSLTSIKDDPYWTKTDPYIDESDYEEAEIVRVVCAEKGDIRLDEKSWKELLRHHDLLADFCEQLMAYLSYLTWTMTKPIAEA